MAPDVSDSTITCVARRGASLGGGQTHLMIVGVDGGQSTL